MKKLRSNLLGIIILIVGVVVGVLLVRQTQNFKNKALEKADKVFTVCHKTGNINNQWEQIEVKSEELPEYLNNGDIFGECPEELE